MNNLTNIGLKWTNEQCANQYLAKHWSKVGGSTIAMPTLRQPSVPLAKTTSFYKLRVPMTRVVTGEGNDKALTAVFRKFIAVSPRDVRDPPILGGPNVHRADALFKVPANLLRRRGERVRSSLHPVTKFLFIFPCQRGEGGSVRRGRAPPRLVRSSARDIRAESSICQSSATSFAGRRKSMRRSGVSSFAAKPNVFAEDTMLSSSLE